MSVTIKWNFVTQAVQRPSVSATASIDNVNANEKFDINLADTDSQAVNLMPVGGTSFNTIKQFVECDDSVFTFTETP